jgi:hypothetical protein
MKGDTDDFDKIDEALMTYDLSDEALEAAARVDGGRDCGVLRYRFYRLVGLA